MSASVEIIVPALGESVSEATVAKWYKKEGDVVKVDELILELETEKVTLEVNATAEGVIESIKVPQGSVVQVGQVVGTIKAGATGAKMTVNPPDNVKQSERPVGMPEAGNISNNQSVKKIDPATAMPPSVRKIVAENNLSPANIVGTGKDGRINKIDAINAVHNQPVSTQGKAEERVKMSRLRRTIAERLKASQNTAAILTTFNEIDMTSVMALRSSYRDEFEKKHGVKLGFMSFFVKAVVNALQETPSVNAEIDGDDIIYKYYYDIGVAVGTDQGLVVPVVRGCDRLGFAEIEKEIASLAGRARQGKLSMADLTGGTFSITNGGVYGSLLSTPIINPPQTGIIGLHNTQQRPVAIDGKVEIRPMMYIALSYDHRIIDGKDAVTFLVKVKNYIENPARLLLNV